MKNIPDIDSDQKDNDSSSHKRGFSVAGNNSAEAYESEQDLVSKSTIDSRSSDVIDDSHNASEAISSSDDIAQLHQHEPESEVGDTKDEQQLPDETPVVPSHDQTTSNDSTDSSLSKDSSSDKPDSPPKKHKFRHKKVVWIPSLLLVVVASTVLTVSVYFTRHTLPKSTVAGRFASLMTREQVETILNQKVSSMNVEVAVNDSKLTPSLQDIGVNIDMSATTDCLFSHKSSLASKLKLWKSHKCEVVYRVDQAKQDSYFSNIKQSVDQPSQDATIIIENGEAVIKPEVLAKVSGFPNAFEKINDSIKNLQGISLEIELYDDKPEVVAADLEQSKRDIDSIIATSVTLNLQGNVLRPNRDQIAGWLRLNQNKETKNVDVSVDELKVSAYLDGAVKPFIKPPRARVILNNPDGTERELNPGEDGVDVSNKQQVVASIARLLSNRQSVAMDLSVNFAPRSSIKVGDYDKWLEVDLTTKRLYAYEKNTLVATFLASAGAPNTPTVVGEFKIQTKVRKQTMRGLNTDGTSYNVPNVEFVSYFYQDYAIHGNYWRPLSVFGEQNTSHGCVGLVNADASWVYDWAGVGTPIITHY